MKIWKWYKNLTTEQREESKDLAIEDRYPLYAFTTNKKYRDLWRKMRKKECFIEKESKVTEEEYVRFANKHNGALLEMHKYQKFDGYDEFEREPHFSTVEVLSTWSEKENVEASLEQFSDGSSGRRMQTYPNPPMMFADEYFKALYDLQYVTLWRLYNDGAQFGAIDDFLEEMLEKMGVEIDYAAPEYDYDSLNAFISLYSYCLKL